MNVDWILAKIKELWLGVGEIDKKVDDFIINTEPTIRDEVDTWLDNHPEATTTVLDNSITEAKIYKPFLDAYRVWINVASMVEDYNLDSSNIKQAILDALDIGNLLYIPAGDYTFTMEITKDCTIIMDDDCIIRTDDGADNQGKPIFTARGCSFNLAGGQIIVGEDTSSRIAIAPYHGAIYLDNCHDCTLSNLYSPYSKTNSIIWVKDSTNVTLENSKFTKFLRAAMYICDACKNITVRNCYFEDSTPLDNQTFCYFVYTGVSTWAGQHEPVDGLIYENNYGKSSVDCAFDTHGAKNVIIRNNTVLDTVNAITAYNDNARAARPAGWCMENILIENNYCKSTRTIPQAAVDAGLAHACLFIGASNARKPSEDPDDYGRYNAFKNCIVRNNVFITNNDYTNGAIYLDAISSHVEFYNNYFYFDKDSTPYINFRRSMYFIFKNNKTESYYNTGSKRCALVYTHCYGEIDKNAGFRHSPSSNYIAHVKGLLPEYDNTSDPTVETGEIIYISGATQMATSYGLRRRDANAFSNVQLSFTFSSDNGNATITSPTEVPFIPNLALEITSSGGVTTNAYVKDIIDLEHFTIVDGSGNPIPASPNPADTFTATIRMATLTAIA